MKTENNITTLCLLLVALIAVSCESYLDAKPEGNMATLETLRDYQSILDNTRMMNANLPGLGEETTDNWYLSPTRWSSLDVDFRNNYCFKNTHIRTGMWGGAYIMVYYANLALEGIQDYRRSISGNYDISNIEGSAYFYRAHAYYHLAQVFAPAYHPEGPNDGLSIVLRHSSAVDEELHRATVAESYAAIKEDLEKAALLLPTSAQAPTRPSRVAAWAMLARVHLLMGAYESALRYADSALLYHDNLLDYSSINSSSNSPFEEYNEEVIFQSRMTTTAMAPSRANINPELFNSYDDGDLRKSLFFRRNSDGTYRFKGSYDGTNSGYLFNGISSAELYLTKAECLARIGSEAEALGVLNTLLKTRWAANKYIPSTLENTADVLRTILTERRKELPYRGLRWPDIRRLAIEGLYTSTISREIEGEVFELAASELPNYTYVLPDEAIEYGGYQQNH